MRSAPKSCSSRTRQHRVIPEAASTRPGASRLIERNTPGIYVAPLVSAALLAHGLWGGTPAQAVGTAKLRLAAATVEVGPAVTILKPGYSEQVQGTTQILIGVQSRRYNPQTIEFFVDDASVNGGPIPLTSLPSAAFNWPTDKYPDGPHKLTVRVADTQGFIGQAEVAVYINNHRSHDTTLPDVSWLDPKPGAELKGTVNIQLNAVAGIGIKYVIVELNPVDKPNQKPPAFAGFLNRPPYIFKVDTTHYPDGNYLLKGRAWDSLENEGDTLSIPIGISNNQISPTLKGDLERRAQAYIKNHQQSATSTTPATPQPTPPATPQHPTDGHPQGTNTSGPGVPGHSVGTRNNDISSGPGDNTGSTQTSDNQGTRVASIDPRVGHGNPVRPIVSPDASLAMSRAQSNGAREGAMGASQTSQNVPAQSAQTQVRPCASVPDFTSLRPMNPHSLTTVQRNVPNIPSPVMPLTPNVDATGEVTGSSLRPAHTTAQTTINNDNTNSTAYGAATPPARVTHLLPEHPAVGNPQPRPVSGANHTANSKPAWTVVGSGAGQTLISPNLPTVDKQHGGLNGQQLAARSTEPNGNPRQVPHQIASATDNSLTRLPADNNSRVAPSVPPNMPDPSIAPHAPRLSSLPPFSGSTRNHSAGAGVITAAPASAWVGREILPVSYVTRRDETLQAVAARYKLPVEVLATANNLPPTAHLAAGAKVLMPQPLRITYKGKPVTGDVASMMVGSTSVTPFRFLFEQQGGTLVWDAAHHRVIAHNASHEVTLAIGSRTATVNNKEVMMDLAAFLCSGRTMVPLRFFETALHAQVEWEPGSGRLYVAMAN